MGDLNGQEVLKGSLYLLLGKRDKVSASDQQCLDLLRAQNETLNQR